MGALLAWRWVAAEVGGVGRGVKAALGDAWTRSDAALAAGPLSPALPARVSGGALSEPQVREAAPGMGGREWPQRPLLCIIVTQAISCLEVWEKGKKKKTQGGGRGVGQRRARKRRPGGDGGAQRLSPASTRPRGCQVREPRQGDTVYCNFGVSGRTERVHPVVGYGLRPQEPPGHSSQRVH